MGGDVDEAKAEVDRVLEEWRQGDCVLGEHAFLYGIDPDLPLTPESEPSAEEGFEDAVSDVHGFMVATQTCDIVRRCVDRPFVEVSPLVVVGNETLYQIQRGRRPNYAYIPGTADRNLVADLDRAMTLEKPLLRKWKRVGGCRSDEEARILARRLARKRARVAFPDDFVKRVHQLQRRLQGKHDKNSDEGRALQSLREIRVLAAPSWDANTLELMFFFIRHEEQPAFENKSWDDWRRAWLNLVEPGGRFTSVDGVVQTLKGLTADDYVHSDPLDLDHLSDTAG